MRRRPPDVSGPGIEVEVVPGEAEYFADAPALAEQQRDRDPQADRRCGGHELASVSGTQRTTVLHAHRPGRVHQVERVGGDQSDLDRLGEDLATGLATAEHGVRSKPIQQRRLPRRQYLWSDVDDTRAAEFVDEVRNRLPVGRERRLSNLVTSNRLEPPVAQLLNGRRDREPRRGRRAAPPKCGDELVAPRFGERPRRSGDPLDLAVEIDVGRPPAALDDRAIRTRRGGFEVDGTDAVGVLAGHRISVARSDTFASWPSRHGDLPSYEAVGPPREQPRE